MYIVKILLVSLSLLLVVGFAKAETIHVDDDNSSGPWDGTQEHPYQYIQDGIDDASYGDTVLVADGIYSGDGNIDLDFKGKAIMVTSKNGATATIIDCEQLGRGFYFHSGETSSSIVSGFTITNGSALDAHRGAICCVNSSGPTIENNVITGNNGGGIYCNLESSPSIRGNTISQNSATFGGAICSAGRSRPVIHENRIYENWASDSGGGIYVTGRSYVEIRKNEVIGNVAGNMGGGICAWDAPTTINDNIIIGNSASGQGGGIRYHEFITSPPTIMANNVIARNSAAKGAGIFYQGAFSPAIVNNSIIGNIASAEGGGIYIEAAATATVLNTVVWANSPDGISFHIRTWVDVAYSDIQEAWPGEGNIEVDPLFVDAANDDYRLSDDSPCIGAGTRETKIPNRDILDKPRPYPSYSKPDMGAYENPLGAGHPPWDVNSDGVVDLSDIVLVGQHLGNRITTLLDLNPDVNGDGIVNILDVILVAQHVGESYLL